MPLPVLLMLCFAVKAVIIMMASDTNITNVQAACRLAKDRAYLADMFEGIQQRPR
jgi:hypothetical protein